MGGNESNSALCRMRDILDYTIRISYVDVFFCGRIALTVYVVYDVQKLV